MRAQTSLVTQALPKYLDHLPRPACLPNIPHRRTTINNHTHMYFNLLYTISQRHSDTSPESMRASAPSAALLIDRPVGHVARYLASRQKGDLIRKSEFCSFVSPDDAYIGHAIVILGPVQV